MLFAFNKERLCSLLRARVFCPARGRAHALAGCCAGLRARGALLRAILRLRVARARHF
jgi:hypothetical protein